MSTAVPTPPGEPDPASGDAPPPPPRKPRKIFLLIGTAIGLVLVVILGLFTHIGTGSSTGSNGSAPSGSAPRTGDPVPAFTATNIGPSGASHVTVSSHDRTPTVLLFFGDWCPSCHKELPPLAAAVQSQQKAGGPLAHIRVVGVDSEDQVGHAKAFIASSGVTFPVAYDPNTTITSGDFWFTGDPYAVFVNGNGTINRIVRGDVLTPSSLTADEQDLIPSGT